MRNSQIRLTHRELYSLVWSAPLRSAAGQLGISDVALAKVCDRHRVPRPPQGHWARAERRRRDEPKPPLGGTPDKEIEIAPVPEQPKQANSGSVPSVRASANLRGAHRIIRATQVALRRGTDVRTGLAVAGGSSILRIEVSPNSVSRALRLFDAVVKAAEARGYTLSDGSGHEDPLAFVVGDQRVVVSLNESLVRTRHEPTEGEREREERFGWASYRRYDYLPSGTLRFRIHSADATPVRKLWSDGKRKLLEDKLGEVAAGIEAAADAQATRDEEREEIRRQWVRREEARGALRRKEAEREARLTHLLALSDRWTQACRIRAFLIELENAVDDRDDELTAWIASAQALLAETDPIESYKAAGLDAFLPSAGARVGASYR